LTLEKRAMVWKLLNNLVLYSTPQSEGGNAHSDGGLLYVKISPSDISNIASLSPKINFGQPKMYFIHLFKPARGVAWCPPTIRKLGVRKKK
jgi:hypothetical protein